jgi:hypothetical protein
MLAVEYYIYGVTKTARVCDIKKYIMIILLEEQITTTAAAYLLDNKATSP